MFARLPLFLPSCVPVCMRACLLAWLLADEYLTIPAYVGACTKAQTQRTQAKTQRRHTPSHATTLCRLIDLFVQGFLFRASAEAWMAVAQMVATMTSRPVLRFTQKVRP